MKEKIKYLLKENWSIKVFGEEIFRNKNTGFNQISILYAISIFFYWLLIFMSVIDLHTLDFYKILSSGINLDLLILSLIWVIVSWIPYKIL